MKRRITSLLLALVMVLSLMPAMTVEAEASTSQVITDKNAVSGSMFTTSPTLAAKLDSIFAGNANIYWDSKYTKPVNTVLGSHSVPNNGVYMYVPGGKAVGTSCFIYANGVYYTLFGETVTNGAGGDNSEKLTAAKDQIMTYQNFVKWGVRQGVGALIRYGTHSIVVLGYDENTLKYIDGNGDKNGLVAVRIRSWDKVSTANILYIVQPKESYFETLYGPASTVTSKFYSSHCQIKATGATTVMTLPCSNGTDASSTVIESVSTGKTLTATALILNTKGNLWYRVTSSSGNTGYVPASKMSWVKEYTSDVTITDHTNPPNMTKGSSYPIKGTIKSTYNDLVKIDVEVTNSSGDVVTGGEATASGKSYTLNSSAIDSNTKFGSLPVGNYTYSVWARYRSYYAANEKTATYVEGWKRVQNSSFTVSASTHTHSWSKKSDSSYHWEACSCGATQNKASHTWNDCYSSSTHGEACAGCGATRNIVAHTWSKKYDSSYHWEACSCGMTRSKASHSWSSKSDGSYRWEACSCGATRNKTAILDTAHPTKPTLNVSINGETATFTWNATAHTTHYNLWVYKQNNDGAWVKVDREDYAQSGEVRALSLGEYRAQLFSYNSNAWESDHSDWKHTGSDYTYFTIHCTNHQEITIPGKAATCTATGLTDGKKCSVCGTVTVKQQVIEKKAHKETTISGKPATCTATGLTDGKKCSVCGTVTVKQQTIAKTAHKETTITGKAATCTATGLTDGKKCSVCGTVTVKQQTIAKLAHSYKNGVCTKCGAKDPNYVAPVAGVDRVYGSSRYDTAFQSADTLKKQMGVEKFSCAIVTSGDNFADALAGSYLAYVKNAPILLTDNDNIGDVMAYIQKNVEKGATVYALGGKAVVTDKLLDLEKKGYDVKRLAGKSRFETNLEILKECGSVAGKDILVCTGFNFADSLSASAAKRPILLVDDKLTDGQKAYLKQQSGCKYCIVGGTGAVTSSVEKSLKSYGSVSRLAGSNRFETSVMVAKKFFSDPTTAVLAYGYNFPDGLCAGPLAATINAPLILTATGDEAQAAAYAKEEGIEDGYVLGGSALINDKAVKKIFSMGSGDKIQ